MGILEAARAVYPCDDACEEAEFFADTMTEYSRDENRERLGKLVAHWVRVFEREDDRVELLTRFREAFNARLVKVGVDYVL